MLMGFLNIAISRPGGFEVQLASHGIFQKLSLMALHLLFKVLSFKLEKLNHVPKI